MKNLTVWLNANKISLNVQKTEQVILKHREKNWTLKLNLNLIENEALVIEIRSFVSITVLKTIYFAIFDSYINYANLA